MCSFLLKGKIENLRHVIQERKIYTIIIVIIIHLLETDSSCLCINRKTFIYLCQDVASHNQDFSLIAKLISNSYQDSMFSKWMEYSLSLFTWLLQYCGRLRIFPRVLPLTNSGDWFSLWNQEIDNLWQLDIEFRFTSPLT